MAQDVWGSGPPVFQKSSYWGISFLEVFAHFLNRCCKEELDLMAGQSRRIWLRRNKLVFQGIFIAPSVVLKEAIEATAEFKKCKEIGSHGSPQGIVSPHGSSIAWKPPLPGGIKVNWDGSINKAARSIGLGCVACDHEGNFLGAKTIFKHMVVDPKGVEVMAALNAVQFCNEVGFFNVSLEGDALAVIKEINSGPPFLSHIGHFVESIHQEVGLLQSSCFNFIPREANSLAHSLAKEAVSSRTSNVWSEEMPTSIQNIVLREKFLLRSLLDRLLLLLSLMKEFSRCSKKKKKKLGPA